MPSRLKNQVAIVTGAGRGLGKAVAKAFAYEGAKVILVSRTIMELEAVAKEIRQAGGEAAAVRADVSQERDVDRLIVRTLELFGTADILVNNAGILTPKGPIQSIKITDWEQTMAVNLRGPFLCIQAVLPIMLKKQSGCIINVSSGAGKRAAPLWGAYAVSKFGVEGLTKVVAEELRPYHIRVNAINPGGVQTAMRAKAYPEEDPLTLPIPDEVASLFVYLASAQAKDVTAESIDWRDWAKRHQPAAVPARSAA
ncbi:MAG: SDR family NAD(P)-dependent oxidoreductase [Candidatus Omnitrophica bacterium]|nr:SDR family NAD(P)-dependent oxidoreductase [Candidatus Omnitrophota bacterium]